MRYYALIRVRLDEASLKDAAAAAQEIANQICDESQTDCADVKSITLMEEEISLPPGPSNPTRFVSSGKDYDWPF